MLAFENLLLILPWPWHCRKVWKEDVSLYFFEICYLVQHVESIIAPIAAHICFVLAFFCTLNILAVSASAFCFWNTTGRTPPVKYIHMITAFGRWQTYPNMQMCGVRKLLTYPEIMYLPRINMSPKARKLDYFNSLLHLPTIDFQGVLWVFRGVHIHRFITKTHSLQIGVLRSSRYGRICRTDAGQFKVHLIFA